MSVTLFQDTTYNLTNLLDNIKRGAIALPDMLREGRDWRAVDGGEGR